MAILKLALLGAPDCGQQQLAFDLGLATLADASPYGQPLLLVDPSPPLQIQVTANVCRLSAAEIKTDLQVYARQHRQAYDLTLLMGLDLLASRRGASAEQAARIDALLRHCLADARIPYQVIYGQGADRTLQAMQALQRAINRPEGLTPPDTAASAMSEAIRSPLFGQQAKKFAWVWMCEKCSDADCEHRTLLAQQASRLLQG